MELTACDSSNVKAYGYDHMTETLGIQFKDYSIYHWSTIPKKAYELFVSAESKGKYLHTVIRPTYGDGVKQPTIEVL